MCCILFAKSAPHLGLEKSIYEGIHEGVVKRVEC